jgi:hypothetical protein
MVEILWNSNAPHLPIQDHELVELRLVDLGSTDRPRYLVREIHASWSASAQQIEWKGFEDATFGTRHEAQRSFAKRKASIARVGFPYTTRLN